MNNTDMKCFFLIGDWVSVLKKRFYNRATIAARNYKIQQMAFIPPSLIYNSDK